MKRVVIEIEEEMHRELKVHCFTSGFSMKDYVTELIRKDLETKKEQTQ